MRANVDPLNLSTFGEAKFIIYRNKKCNSEAKIFSFNRTASQFSFSAVLFVIAPFSPQFPLNSTWLLLVSQMTISSTKTKLMAMWGEPHTEGKNCDKRQYY